MNVVAAYDVIVPVKNAKGRIEDWTTVARVVAGSPTAALRQARKDHGHEADVRFIGAL